MSTSFLKICNLYCHLTLEASKLLVVLLLGAQHHLLHPAFKLHLIESSLKVLQLSILPLQLPFQFFDFVFHVVLLLTLVHRLLFNILLHPRF